MFSSLANWSRVWAIFLWKLRYTLVLHMFGMVWRSRTISHFHHTKRNTHITKATPLPCEWLLLITFLEQTKWIFMLWLSIFDTHTQAAGTHIYYGNWLSTNCWCCRCLFMHAVSEFNKYLCQWLTLRLKDDDDHDNSIQNGIVLPPKTWYVN